MTTEFEILLVEDDSVDVLGFRRAIRRSTSPVNLQVVTHGEEALSYLSEKTRKELPHLIILDLNMPVMGGLEFLSKLKGEEDLRKIPVVVMTTSSERSDIDKSYELGAAGYMVKPLNNDEFVEKVSRLKDYWASCERPDFRVL